MHDYINRTLSRFINRVFFTDRSAVETRLTRGNFRKRTHTHTCASISIYTRSLIFFSSAREQEREGCIENTRDALIFHYRIFYFYIASAITEAPVYAYIYYVMLNFFFLKRLMWNNASFNFRYGYRRSCKANTWQRVHSNVKIPFCYFRAVSSSSQKDESFRKTPCEFSLYLEIH